MPSRLRTRLRDETGFSLVEVLVVVIIAGILAAIAIPAFVGQKQKPEDGAAKSNARNLAELVEACATNGDDYRNCDTPAELPKSGLDLGDGAGKVKVTAATRLSFEVAATSKVGHVFRWTRDTNGNVARTCTAGAGDDDGGCNGGSW
jgi:type IV pilus assembly protein PilA